MPNRPVTLAIVAFWLVMAGLFGYEQLLPSLAPSEPLMFPVDVVDEAGPQSEVTNWEVTKNGTKGYRADVDWRYRPEDDAFESECVLAWRLREWLDFGWEHNHVRLQAFAAWATAPGGAPLGPLAQVAAAWGAEESDQLAVLWEQPRPDPSPGLPQIHDVSLKRSVYRLTRHGEMRSITVASTYSLVRGQEYSKGIK